MFNKVKLFMFASVVALAGCGDDGANGANGAMGLQGEMGAAGLNSLLDQVALSLGDDNCRFGGTQINSGLDTDGSGVLEAGEVTETTFVCNADEDIFELQVLHFADVDGGGDIVNNAPRFSAILNEFRSEAPNNTVVLSSGDNWIPGPEYSVAADPAFDAVVGAAGAGRAHVDWLNEMGVQASALGNHEFDLGPDDVAGLIAADGAYAGATFPYLATNLDFSGDADLGPLSVAGGTPTGANQVGGYTILNVGGERIGVIGAITPTLANISSPDDVVVQPMSGTTADLAALIQADVDSLTAQGVDKIILLGHMQTLSVERELAGLLSGVDIIIGGGSNTLLADSTDRLRDGDTAAGTYPELLTSESDEPVLLVNTDGDFNYLGRLNATFDVSGVIIPEFLDETNSGAYATDEAGLTENGLVAADAIAGVQATSDALQGGLETLIGNTFGATSVFLDGRRSQVRTQETNMGNLTADANLAAAQAVEPTTTISLKNGGGIRAEIGFSAFPAGSTNADDLAFFPPSAIEGIREEGEVSQLDIETTLRFNNGLTLLTVTGFELAELMEHSIGFDDVGVTQSGRFPQIGGMTMSFDPAQTGRDTDGTGARIQSLIVLDDNGAAAGGSPVTIVENGVLNPAAATQTFRMVTLGFLAGGGDGYPFPATPAANVVDLEMEGLQTGAATFADDGSEQDALAEYLLQNFPLATPFDAAETPAAEDSRIVNLAITQ